MRKIVFSVLLIFASSASAQIVIDVNDMPVVGDTLVYSTAFLTTFDGADTGPNHMWDFSGLTAFAQEADTVRSVSSTPFLYQFFFNNPFLYPDHDADHSFRGADLDFQAITVNDLYDYYASDNSGYRNVGFGANINGLPSSVQRVPTDEIYAFPLAFGNTSSSVSSFEISVPTIVFIRQDQVRTNEVDGWGSLILPGGALDVLRVKSVLDRTDSVYVNALMFGLTIPEPQTIEYKWLAAGEHRPVLQVNTTAGIVTGVQFKQDSLFNSIADRASDRELSLFPNPAQDLINVATDGTSVQTIELYTADGRLLESRQIKGRVSWDVSGLEAGHYLLRSGTVVRKFVKID